MNINDLVPVEYQEQRLLTGKQLAEFYGTTTARIRDNFVKAKKHFDEGRDYFKLSGDTLRDVKEDVERALFSYSQPLSYRQKHFLNDSAA